MDQERLLVFGADGQLGRALYRASPKAAFVGRDVADLSDPESCALLIRERRPGAVINAAAWTAVDAAEGAEERVRVINGAAPGRMAAASAELDIPFVHVSTDYVFDGSGSTPRRPGDPVGPLSAYGRSKLAGERAVVSARGRSAIVRTSWVFSADGANFVKTMLRVGTGRTDLQVVADQIGGPTPAEALAEACLTAAAGLATDQGLSGIYHYSGRPDVSWADFARAIFKVAGYAVRVHDITTSAYPTPASRPLNSRLDCSSFEAAFGVERPEWHRYLAPIIEEVGAQDAR